MILLIHNNVVENTILRLSLKLHLFVRSYKLNNLVLLTILDQHIYFSC